MSPTRIAVTFSFRTDHLEASDATRRSRAGSASWVSSWRSVLRASFVSSDAKTAQFTVAARASVRARRSQ